MRGRSVERLLRRIVRNKIIMTVAIALAGGAMVALSPEEGRWLLWAGAAIMIASPWISYVLILALYREAVINYRDDEGQ